MAASKAYLAIVCIGVFAVMALSNAVVPVLTVFAGDSAWQGAIYAAYFFGAFVSTLPGGLLSDRHGSVLVIRTGLLLTVVSGTLLFFASTPFTAVMLRGCEGIGAGLFVAAALSYINSRDDHILMSGYYMAMLNLGLVLGLVIAGWLAVQYSDPALGIGVFTLFTLVACAGSMLTNAGPGPGGERINSSGMSAAILHRPWLWYSVVVLVGITGVVSSLYPKFSGETPDMLGLWIAGMSVATIITVVIISRVPLPPVPVIRWCAVFMAAGVLIAYFTPLGFIVLGSFAGVVMIAQMAILAGDRAHQGLLMGLFSTTSYLGMAVLPFVAGIVAETGGFLLAFVITAVVSGSVAVFMTWSGFRSCTAPE